MSSDLGLGQINRRAYASEHSQHIYGRASGSLDQGEKVAMDLVCSIVMAGAILDIGFGGGRTVPLLRDISPNYIGIDFTPELVTLARCRYPDADLRQMDARGLEFEPETFQLTVFSWNGIDAVDPQDQAQILREVHRVLRPGGYFVFCSRNRDAPDEPPPKIRFNGSTLRSFLGSVLRTARITFRRYRFRNLNVTSGDWYWRHDVALWARPAAAAISGTVVGRVSFTADAKPGRNRA